jgi:hypothetical protein
MSASAVAAIEKSIGRPLPETYRAFLVQRTSSYLDPSWLVKTEEAIPGGGPEEYLRSLLTAQELLANGLVGEPEEGMMVVGEIEPGGYLYLSIGPTKPGAFFARFPFNDPKFYLVARSFDELLQCSRPDQDEQA